MKFTHMGDCHLGGWRQPELKDLNSQSFQTALKQSIKENVDFILIAGDLFDSPYPSVEVLKDAFNEFRKIKEAKIPVFLIAGSHDYSVSGKTFLEVLEKAGFCKNVSTYQERNGKIMLIPTIHKNVAIYGYPGRKSGLEVEDIEKIILQDSPGLFKILMLHTTIKDAINNIPIKSVDQDKLPKVDYLALAHLHINYNKNGRVYSGPIFPNEISELEELGGGSYYLFNNGKIIKKEIKLKDVESFNLEITDAWEANNKILNQLTKKNLKDKIVILRLYGVLKKGKISDINLSKVEEEIKKAGAYSFLKSTTKLHMPGSDLNLDISFTKDLEENIINEFEKKNPNKLNYLSTHLIRSLQSKKAEDETSSSFRDRILKECRKTIKL